MSRKNLTNKKSN